MSNGSHSKTVYKNIIYGFVSGFLQAAINVICLPVMLNLYGPQSMGIIGLFTTIQALFVLFDVGLGPLVARKTALRRHGQELNYSYLVGILGRYFLILGSLGLLCLFMLRDRITASWMNNPDKSIENLGSIFIIMSLIVFLRWVQTYAKSILFGSERIMWVSNLNILFMVLKYPFVLFIFQIDNPSLLVFMSAQLILTTLETLLIYREVNKDIPLVRYIIRLENKTPILEDIRFASTVSIGSIIWIPSTQIDKIILFRYINLGDFGLLTLATTLSSYLLVVAQPITSALTPRLTSLLTQNNDENVASLYIRGSTIYTILAAPVILLIFFASNNILQIWLGHGYDLTSLRTPFVFYSIGYYLCGLSSFTYSLQVAKGSIKYHLYGNITHIVLYCPLALWSFKYYGILGISFTWMALSLLYLVIWVNYIHSRLLPSLKFKWISQQLFIYAACAPLSSQVAKMIVPDESRAIGVLSIFQSYICLLLISVSAAFLCSKLLKKYHM